VIVLTDETGTKAPDGLRWVPLLAPRTMWIAIGALTVVGGLLGVVLAIWYLLGDSAPHQRITAAFLVAGWTFVGMGLGLLSGEMVRLERIEPPPSDDGLGKRGLGADGVVETFLGALKGLPAQRVPLALGVLLLLAAAYLAKPGAGVTG
jgi:hypothetical protein